MSKAADTAQNETPQSYALFAGTTRIARGTLEEVARSAKEHFDRDPTTRLLVFNESTGRQTDFDLSAGVDAVVAQASALAEGNAARGRGRPKLGVECGEVCLLPRHWEWLAAQPRSASATIRRLIDAARKAETPEDRLRERIDAAGTFMWAMAGDLTNFEEASRALYAKEWDRLHELIDEWPEDVRAQVDAMLAAPDGSDG